jgi:hypothetical protein
MVGRRQQTRFIVPSTVEGRLSIRDGDLVTEVPVVLRELSSDGCLVESQEEVAEDAEGELDLRIDGHPSRDEVRVVRCHSQHVTNGAYRIAAKFIGPVSDDVPASVRSESRAKEGEEGACSQTDSLKHAGEKHAADRESSRERDQSK